MHGAGDRASKSPPSRVASPATLAAPPAAFGVCAATTALTMNTIELTIQIHVDRLFLRNPKWKSKDPAKFALKHSRERDGRERERERAQSISIISGSVKKAAALESLRRRNQEVRENLPGSVQLTSSCSNLSILKPLIRSSSGTESSLKSTRSRAHPLFRTEPSTLTCSAELNPVS